MSDYQDLVARYLAVWNEQDAAARATLAAKLFAEDVHYVDPLMDVRGADQLAAAIGAVHQQFPGWTFRAGMPVDGHHDQLRFGWVLGPDEGTAPVEGFDVATLDATGRIARVLGFLDRVPA